MKNKKVLFFDDEREIGNSIIVTLNYGWRFMTDTAPVHVEGFDTMREANQAIKEASPCDCKECRIAFTI